MPVILAGRKVDEWLHHGAQDVDELQELLRPAADDLFIAAPGPRRANSVKNDDAGVLEPVDGAA